MTTMEEIERMFHDIGLFSEEERIKLLRFAGSGQREAGPKEMTFILSLAHTIQEKGENDGELE